MCIRTAQMERRMMEQQATSPTIKRPQPVPSLEGWHDIRRWAEAEGRHQKTIHKWCRMGLRHSKIGACTLVHEQDMAAFKASRARGGNLKRGAS
jgi:hypothetical protein